MTIKINAKFEQLTVPGIRVFANEVSKFEDGINFTIGEPDFPTPERVKEAAIQSIVNNQTGYSHNAGLAPLRNAISSFFHEEYGVLYDPEEEIVVTTGASEAIDALLRVILLPGEEVIIPAPVYSGYEPLIELAGCKTKYLDTTSTNFIPTAEQIESLITPQTKAIILNYPSNPTGVVLTKSQMDEIVEVVSKHQLFVITDEIYSENSYSGKHLSFAQYPQLRDQLFLIHGVSKSHAMTGWRIGYILGPSHLMEHVLKSHLFGTICATLPSQYAAIEALNNCREIPAIMNESYIERRDYIYSKLIELGFDVIKPNGAFYIFPSIRKTGLTSWEFATRLLEEEHVAVVPGSAFSEYGEGYIRISYANSLENIKLGMERLEKFIQRLDV